jgi:sugar phosphate isomerase/epimerase
MNRREFILTSSAALAPAPARPTLCVFSKHLAKYNWDELGARAKALGFAGVDLTVRPKGHVLPERVADDLPRAYEAITKHGLSVPMITTDLKDASDPAAKPTFEAMRKLGIRLYKPGYWPYAKEPRLADTLKETARRARQLVELSSSYGLTAGLHNHSGANVGCAVWDYREILAGLDAAGYYFDPAHAVIEGGLFNWRVSLDLVLPRMRMSAIKDFYWEKQDGHWRVRWCPLGQGMVPWKEVFAAYAKAGFAGPLSLHSEYPGGEDEPAMRKDMEFLSSAIAAAY